MTDERKVVLLAFYRRQGRYAALYGSREDEPHVPPAEEWMRTAWLEGYGEAS